MCVLWYYICQLAQEEQGGIVSLILYLSVNVGHRRCKQRFPDDNFALPTTPIDLLTLSVIRLVDYRTSFEYTIRVIKIQLNTKGLHECYFYYSHVIKCSMGLCKSTNIHFYGHGGYNYQLVFSSGLLVVTITSTYSAIFSLWQHARTLSLFQTHAN